LEDEVAGFSSVSGHKKLPNGKLSREGRQ
jgi:hypothetical protein